MSIKIKLLLAACLLLEFTNSTATDDSTLAHEVASVDGYDVNSNNEDEIHVDGVDRMKRLSTDKLKESLDNKLKESLDKISQSVNSRLDSSILGSIRNSALLKTKSKIPSLLDIQSTLGSSLSKGISPLFGTITKSTTIAPKTTTSGKRATTTKTTIAPLIPSLFKKNIDIPTSTTAKPNKKQISEAKPVVLPDYLMDKDTNKHEKFAHNRISAQQLRETSDLRNEINYAVKHNIYVHSSSDVRNMNQKSVVERRTEAPVYYIPAPPPPPPQVAPPTFESFFADFWDNLIGRGKARKNEPTVGSARSDFSYVPDSKPSSGSDVFDPSIHDVNQLDDNDRLNDLVDSEDETVEKMMAKMAIQAMNQGIMSNTVESYANNMDAPHMDGMDQVREELNLTSITEDMSFNIGENVLGWRTLQRNNRESHALIGLTNSSLILVQEKNGTYTLESEVKLLSAPTFFVTFTYWNQTRRTIDGIVIVSIQHEIVFYRVNEAMNKMEFMWMWPTIHVAKYIHHFVIDNSDTLLIISDLHDGSAASLYRFDMNQQAFFLRESITLKAKAKNMALVQAGHDTFMCFPQSDHAVIYKYVQSRFQYHTKIQSQHAEILSSFEMGGYSYLSIGGNEPKILRYHRGNFIDQTILSKSWGYVEFFLPVPARTYRDDLILFVQHRMDYGSHTHSFVEALIWSGHAFYPALSVPCYVNDHVSEFGIGCILDQDRDLGIIGATTFQRNRTITVLVPRHEAPSGLFYLKTSLLPAVSTMNEHLLELLSEVMILLGTRDEVLKNAQEFIQNFPKEPVDEITIKDQNIDVIYTQMLELDSLVPTKGIFLGNELITPEKVNEFLQLLNETETDLKLLEELNRNKRESGQRIQNLHLESVDVDELYVNYINDISTDDFVYVENGTLTLNGTVVLSQPLEVENVERFSHDDLLQAELNETTTITGDLNFEEINGMLWKDFINQIVLKHLPAHLDELEVVGAVFANDSVTVETLNDLPFPDGYVRTDGTEAIIVTGQKTFQNVLVTEALDCATLNGIQTSDIITLNGSQFIPGTTTFRHLEVTESLNIGAHGTISGRHLDEFLSNPTLLETNQIRANVIFNTLEIEQSLYVQNTIDGVHLDDVLSDIVYKHEPNPKINSFKKFQSVQAPNIKLTSKFINDHQLSSFVTRDTEQTFHQYNKLHANVVFQHLHLDGLFNFINVTDLDMNSIKLFGDQYTDAELIFKDGDYLHIDAKRLDVLDTINNVDVHDFIDIDENFELSSDVEFDSLQVNQMVVKGEILGSADSKVNNRSLTEIWNSHFSRTRDQNITEPMHINTVILRGGFDADFINGFDFKKAINILKNLETNEEMLNKSNVIIDKMIINGSAWFTQVNGFDFEKIKANAIRLDQPNLIDLPIVFLDPVYINGNMHIDQLNDEHFDTLVADLVRKSANTTKIYGTTVFTGDVIVLNNLETATINNLDVGRILTKNFNQEIKNPIEIYGDVYASSLIVEGKLNGVPANEFDKYSYDERTGMFTLHKNVYFNESITTKYLYMYNGFNDFGNVQEYMNNLIRTDRPGVITGTKTFTGTVHFDGAVDIGQCYGVDVQDFISNVVYIDQHKPAYVYANVVFNGPVTIPKLEVAGDLVTTHLGNYSVTDWVQNSIRKDRPFYYDGTIVFPPGTFIATNIYTQYLNDNAMEDLLTLNTPQNFSGAVRFNEVYSSVPITTYGLVNGYDLPEERQNTLMVYGDQYIQIPTVFSSIRVLKDLKTEGLVNGRDLRTAVTLQNGVFIDSPLSFGTVAVDRIYTNDLISGIDFDKWFATGFQRWTQNPQVVTAPWTIKYATIDSLNVYKGINGMDVNQFLQYASKIKNDVKPNCQKNATQNNAIFLSHFEKSFTIDEENAINSIYFWYFNRQNNFVINTGCQTSLYIWDDQAKKYTLISTAVTGEVSDWIHMVDAANQLFIISNNDGSLEANCPISGAFIWTIDPNDMSLNQQGQFGSAGEFRAIHTKPNSRAFFWALRNSDSHIIEFDLRGAAVTELDFNNTVTPVKSDVQFVPPEANLGMALSNGNQLSLLTSCNCINRTKRCSLLTEVMNWNNLKSEHRKQFTKTIEKFRTDLNKSRNVLKSILVSMQQGGDANVSSRSHQTKVDQLTKIIEKSKQRTSELLSSFNIRPNNVADDVKVTSTATIQHKNSTRTEASSTPDDRIFDAFMNGLLVFEMVNAIDDAVENEKKLKSAHFTQNEEEVGSGATLVNLIDLVEKIIDENREKHQKEDPHGNQYENYYRTTSQLNRTEIGKMLKDSLVLNDILQKSNATNQSNPQVGSVFGMFMLEKTLAHTLNRSSKLFSGNENSKSHETTDELDLLGETSKEQLDKSIAQFKSDLDKSRNILKSIQMAKEQNGDVSVSSRSDQTSIDELTEIIVKSKQRTSQILSSLNVVSNEAEDDVKVSSTATVQHKNSTRTEDPSTPDDRIFDAFMNGLLVFEMVNAIDDAVENDKKLKSALSADSSHFTQNEEKVGSGATLVNLIDLVEKIIDENREKHRIEDPHGNQNENYYRTAFQLNRTEIGKMLKDSLVLNEILQKSNATNQSNPQVGSVFGMFMLEKTLAHTLNRSSKLVSGNEYRQNDETTDELNLLGETSKEQLDKSIAQFKSDLDKIQNILKSIQMAKEQNGDVSVSSRSDQTSIDELTGIIVKSKQRTSQILSCLNVVSNEAADDVKVTSTATIHHKNNTRTEDSNTPDDRIFDAFMNGLLVFEMVNAIDDAVENDKKLKSAHSTQSAEEVGSGATLVNLIDLVEKIIDENREKHRKEDPHGNQNENYYRTSSQLNRTEIGKMLKDSLVLNEILQKSNATNQSNPQVGSVFGMFMLEKTLAHTLNLSSKHVLKDESGTSDETTNELNLPNGLSDEQLIKSISQFQTDLDESRNILKSIQMAKEQNGDSNVQSDTDQIKIDKLTEIIVKSKPRTSQILSSLHGASNKADDVKVSSTAPNQHKNNTSAEDTTSDDSDFETFMNGLLILNLMDAIDDAVENDKTIKSGSITNSSHSQRDDEDGENVGSGATLVNLIDLVEKIIDENREKHKKEDPHGDHYENYYRTASQLNRTEIGKMLNDSLVLNDILVKSNATNQTDPQVGSLFGIFMLEKTFLRTIDRASKFVLGSDDEENTDKTAVKVPSHKKSGLLGLLSSTNDQFESDSKDQQRLMETSQATEEIGNKNAMKHSELSGSTDNPNDEEEISITESTQRDIETVVVNNVSHQSDSKQNSNGDDLNQNALLDILSMISEAENATNEANINKEEDPNVGDAFGDAMYKFTPTADDIFDKIVDEIRRRKYEEEKQYQQDPYEVGSPKIVSDGNKGKVPSRMSGFFKNVGRSVVNAYVIGKKRFRNVESWAKDVKFLYNTYYYLIENQMNHNKTLKQTEQPIHESTTPIHDSTTRTPDETINATTMTPTAFTKETNADAVVEHQEDMKMIANTIPNARDFIASYSVEIIKSFLNSSEIGNQSHTNHSNLWPVVRNGVKSAFDMHGNETQKSKINETEMNEIIATDLIRMISRAIEEMDAKKSSEEQVGSAVGDLHSDDTTEIETENPMVGDQFGDLFEKFTPLVDFLSDKIVNELRRRQYDERYYGENSYNSEYSYNNGYKSYDLDTSRNTAGVESDVGEFEGGLHTSSFDMPSFENLFETPNNFDSDDNSNSNESNQDSVSDILSMISEAENATNEANINKEEDPNVGDAFGDAMYKFTPTADDIFDKIVDEIRRRKYEEEKQYQQDPYEVGSAKLTGDGKKGKVPSRMSGFFKKIGRSVVNAYVIGKKRFRKVKSWTKDVKFLYDTYYYLIENQMNHNKTLEQTEPSIHESTTPFHVSSTRTPDVKINATTMMPNVFTTETYADAVVESSSKEHQEDIKMIANTIPNARDFIASYSVEIIKSFLNSSEIGNQSHTNDSNLWPVVRNGVKSAFDMHGNETQKSKINETEMNEIIATDLIRMISRAIEEMDAKKSSEEQVGSTVGDLHSDDTTETGTENPMLGDQFGDLFEKFTPLVDFLSDKIVNELRRRQYAENSYNSEYSYNNEYKSYNVDASRNTAEVESDVGEFEGSLHTSTFDMPSFEDPFETPNNFDSDDNSNSNESNQDSISDILSMISEAENATNEANINKEEDLNVGDAFGDAMYKFTPTADDIFDKIVDEIRRRKYEEEKQYQQDPYRVGSAKMGDDDIKVSSRMTGFFKNIGLSLVNVYVVGKNRCSDVKKWVADLKYLHDTYFYDNYIEDNKNDNKTYGPTEPPNDADTENPDTQRIESATPEIKLSMENPKTEHQNDMEIITNTIPNARLFIANYSVEIIKSFVDTREIGNQSYVNESSFWSVLRNGVKSAFDMHVNDTQSGKITETELNEIIATDLIRMLNIAMEDMDAKNSSDQKVGSTLNDSNVDATTENGTENPLVGDLFGNLFDKLTPLVDFLSDKIVNELRRRQYAEHDSKNSYNNKGGDEYRSNNAEISPNDTRVDSTLSETECNRQITMKEFKEKLNELKHDGFDVSSLITPTESTKEITDKMLGLQKTNSIDTTVVSIPNKLLSSHKNKEIVAVRVGPNQDLLIAVSSITENKIKSDHDRIQIFENVIDGKLFQTISCYKPRSLTSFNINMDTIIAFIQDDTEVRTYVFRGVQGFVEFTSLPMPSPIKLMTHYEIMTHPTQPLCPDHFLIVITSNQAIFYKATRVGNCDTNQNLKC